MKLLINFKKNITIHIKNNLKEYTLVFLIFIIGLFIGVMVVNNCKENQMNEVSTFITDFIAKFKTAGDFDKSELTMQSIRNNVILALILWLAGTTVIGIPIVFVIILLRGIALGFTISSITYTLGTGKGVLFCLASIGLQNLIFIPIILSLGVSSIRLYKSIVKDKRKDNIKLAIIKHTLISSLLIFGLVISSFIQNICSLTILQKMIKYF